MDVLIIEDEEVAAERLESMLTDIDPEVNVLAKPGSVKEAVSWLRVHTADLIFVDIQLSDGLSFAIFDEIPVSTPLIFTTAYDQYAIQAFKHNSISYLLKPIRKKELAESLGKFRRLKTAFGIDFGELRSVYQYGKKEYKKRFLVSIGEKLKKVEVEKIAYFYAMEKSVFFKTFDNKTLSVDQSLDALEEELDPDQFFRINRKYIVNLDSIEEMVLWSRSRIKLFLTPGVAKDEDTVVSISRSSDFKKWMNS
ncbi:MAG TPA: LytTR family DNA-binding domain-containing protein [Balneolaceae bacterium]|nr:LytTR family DNA-binding domain-containing protein [Balneolaceae bacterium]